MAQRLGARKLLASKMQAGQGGRINIINDGKDCDDCRKKSGQYRDFSGVQKPPFHPNCRCSVK